MQLLGYIVASLLLLSQVKSSFTFVYLDKRTITLNNSFLKSSISNNNIRNEQLQQQDPEIPLPSVIQHTVLKDTYPNMIKHLNEYGNPNIPLGTPEGKQCKIIRRLFLQKKLTDDEIELLQNIKFRLTDLEEIYNEADFNDIVTRLVKYKKEYNNLQVPKKYKHDPELGAWVAMVRRMGPDGIPELERDRLNEVGFEWVSTRKCGSSFLKNFRAIEEVLKSQKELDEKQQQWLKAQVLADKKGNLNESRQQYLGKLFSDFKSIIPNEFEE